MDFSSHLQRMGFLSAYTRALTHTHTYTHTPCLKQFLILTDEQQRTVCSTVLSLSSVRWCTRVRGQLDLGHIKRNRIRPLLTSERLISDDSRQSAIRRAEALLRMGSCVGFTNEMFGSTDKEGEEGGNWCGRVMGTYEPGWRTMPPTGSQRLNL